MCTCTHAKLLYSCLTLCSSMDHSPQASLSMGFSRQEYWSGLSCSPQGDLPHPGIETTFLRSPALAGRFFTLISPGKPHTMTTSRQIQKRVTILCLHRYPLSIKNTNVYLLVYLSIYSILYSEYNADHKVIIATI